MIKRILIHNIATYKNPVEIYPKKLNFIYGSNGSGKTTISNLIKNFNLSNDCLVEMKNSNNISTLVYNKKFVEENFSQSTSNLKGIFTLGEDSIHLQEELKQLENENQDNLKRIEKKEETIKNFNEEIGSKERLIKDKCWEIQQKIGNDFSEALIGYRNSKQKFMDKCINIYSEWNKKNDESIEKIKENYNICYSKNSQIYSLFPIIDISEIQSMEESQLLQKVITGSKESPIGQFIELLNNSDWMKQGLKYIPNSKEQCPFCQQSLSKELKQEIVGYFDEEYEKDVQRIKEFNLNYMKYFENVGSTISEILNSPIPFIDTSSLSDEYIILDKQIKLNEKELENKLNSPSNKVTIKSVEDLIEKINKIIDTYNVAIISNNDIVKNQEKEQQKCRKSLWFYIVKQLEKDLKDYLTFEQGKQKAKTSINKQIFDLKKKIRDNEIKINTIEGSLTSVAPTAKEINEILKKFDFKGFYLKENKDQKGTYLILRDDGTNASDTLSEGEYNFITFLYFYYLVYGSHKKTGITSNKIVVIDDPISSLDSNVLFIVSTLVKNLINDCKNNHNGIKQTLILTHNIYFHKEITFLGSRKQYSEDEVLFGIVRKRDNISAFQVYDKNPIQSSYQLMWRELTSDKISTITSFNTMRRILEYYFKIIGDMDYEKCINELEGTDKLLCKALVSGINDGSHFISDDFVIAFDEENIEKYKRVFQLVFEKLGHTQHYNMMVDKSIHSYI
ncbi:AAA family ATPase [Staphylococcus xylosus]